MTEVSNVANTVLTTLDIGSGIDSAKLARDLTDAIKIPQEGALKSKIDASEASISAYGLVKYQINALKTSFGKLNDANELATSSGISSNTAKISVSSVAGTAAGGSYDFAINQLAQNQRVMSDQYTSEFQALNGNSSFDITLAVGTTKSATTAIYEATLNASETTTLVVGDGVTEVSIPSASYTNIDQQVTAIQNGTNYSSLLFTVAKNTAGDAIEFTYKSAGAVASTPTFTGSGSSHLITNPIIGVSVLTPVSGIAAKYNATASSAETTTLVVSDGVTTVSVDSATYTSLTDQVTAIKAATGYDNLQFTVAANSAGNGFEFTYKTTAAVTIAPTLTGSGSSHTISNTVTGRTPINAATTTTVTVGSDSPSGVISAINAANTGVTATLVNTGTGSNSFRIILTGDTGSNGVFALTSSPDLGFHDTANLLQSAQDSIINFEGITVTRATNALDDIVSGATINLLETTATDVRVTVTNDKSELKTSIQNVVASYNDLLVLVENFTSTDSEAEMAGALSEDGSLVRFLKDKIRASVFSDSSSASGNIVALRDIGMSVNQSGAITFDAVKYDAAVSSNYDDIVTMLTAGTSNANLFDDSNKGLAQDIITALESLTDASGVVANREISAKSKLSDHELALTKLETRMEVIYNRYLTQFGAMEGLMATLDSTKDYLTSQFETLSKAYDS